MEDFDSLKEKVQNGTASEEEKSRLGRYIEDIADAHRELSDNEAITPNQQAEIHTNTKAIWYRIRET
jgi:hypothetical protein